MEDKLAKARKFILILSAAIPLLVALLIFSPIRSGLSADWIKMLPGFHALVNSTTVFVLIFSLFAIKTGNVEWHKRLMFLALALGGLFLMSYVLYHSSAPSVKFGDANHNGILEQNELDAVGNSRMIYLGILLSHILLSIAVVPLVLYAFYYALSDQIEKHRRLVKFTFPIWLYVSVTGVVVYLMISPYYL